MDNKTLTLSGDEITIHGKYYTLSNGFLSKSEGDIKLRRNDLLSIELVKRRSKKAMYTVLLAGCILISILSIARVNVGSALNSTTNAYKVVQYIQEHNLTTHIAEGLKSFLTVMILLTFILAVSGAIYIFSGRLYIELTTTRGTYRVPIKRTDTETINVTAQLRSRM